jgi:hypothetical protein
MLREVSLCMHAATLTPVDPLERNRSEYPAAAAFPVRLAGRLPHCGFRGLLGVHSRYGLHARGIAYATLCIKGFDGFVTSTAAPIATGWSDQLPGGNYTH